MMGGDFRIPSRWIARLWAFGCAAAVSACSQVSPLEPGSDPFGTSAAAGEPRACRPDPALLAPQPAPDCGFGRADLKTVDPDQWVHLKLEYELKCYREAEKIARARLRFLQAAARCEAPAAR
jgi:hypothetical protein